MALFTSSRAARRISTRPRSRRFTHPTGASRRSAVPCGRPFCGRVDHRRPARLEGELGDLPRFDADATHASRHRRRVHRAAAGDGVRGSQRGQAPCLTAPATFAPQAPCEPDRPVGFRPWPGRRRVAGSRPADPRSDRSWCEPAMLRGRLVPLPPPKCRRSGRSAGCAPAWRRCRYGPIAPRPPQ